jgi:hypothetical protein
LSGWYTMASLRYAFLITFSSAFSSTTSVCGGVPGISSYCSDVGSVRGGASLYTRLGTPYYHWILRFGLRLFVRFASEASCWHSEEGLVLGGFGGGSGLWRGKCGWHPVVIFLLGLVLHPLRLV